MHNIQHTKMLTLSAFDFEQQKKEKKNTKNNKKKKNKYAIFMLPRLLTAVPIRKSR